MRNAFVGPWKTLAISSGVVAVALAALSYALLTPKMAGPPVASFPPPTSQVEGMLQDLEYLANFAELNRSFTAEQREQFEAAIELVRSDVPDLNPASFEMRVSQAVAIADQGHARVRGVAYGLSLNSLPIRVNWFEEGLYITSILGPWESLLGQQVVAIEDRDPRELATLVQSLVGGPESLKRELSPRLLLVPAMLEAFGATGDAIGVQLTLLTEAGLEHTVTLPAEAGPAHGMIRTEEPWRTMNNNRWPRRDLSPVTFPGDERPWRHLLANADELPLYLQRPDDWYWDVGLGEGASFLQVNAVRDQIDQPSLKAYLQQYLDRLSQDETNVVVLDLRANTGGNADLTTQFAERLPDVVGEGGKIFVLIGGNTFSAAIVMAARLKHFGKGKVVLVGEPLGDRPQFWAEGRTFKLPNSGLDVQWTVSYHDWENGCSIWQLLICHPLNYLTGVAAGSLEADVPLSQSFADYRIGIDGALAAITFRNGGPPDGAAE